VEDAAEAGGAAAGGGGALQALLGEGADAYQERRLQQDDQFR